MSTCSIPISDNCLPHGGVGMVYIITLYHWSTKLAQHRQHLAHKCAYDITIHTLLDTTHYHTHWTVQVGPLSKLPLSVELGLSPHDCKTTATKPRRKTRYWYRYTNAQYI